MIPGALSLELAVIGLALVVLLLDLWTPPQYKHHLGCLAIAGLLVILGVSFMPVVKSGLPIHCCNDMFVQDGLALFFKRIFLITAVFVIIMAAQFRERFTGIGEFHVIVLIALSGMMFAASVNDFVMLYVSLEMMSVSFYVLVSFQRSQSNSLEAGVKYLIMSGVSAAVLIFGIALIFGTAGGTSFDTIAASAPALAQNPAFMLGVLLVLLGLAFKISSFPMQMWTPDVYQGAPTPVTAFLGIGSKAAGFALLMRVLFVAAPALATHWNQLLCWAAALAILYGNLCAIPQRSLKRLLGYSSISNSGYMLLGIAALNYSGQSAVLYYLIGYAFTLAAAFLVLCLVARETDDIAVLAGLNQRSPLLAFAITLAMISLAGLPPLAGFLGKLFLLKAILLQAQSGGAYLCLALVTVAGVVISIYYYFGVIRVIYWPRETSDLTPIPVSWPVKLSLAVCILAMLYLGIFPESVLTAATHAVHALHL